MKYALYSFQLLVTHADIELVLINAICVIPQGCISCQILSPYSFAPWSRAALSSIPIQCSKMYGGMLKIGLQPSKPTDSRPNILRDLIGSRVTHRVWLLVLLWSRFLFLFLFSTIISLTRHYQRSGWTVCLVEYTPWYRQSLMWRVAWHHTCGIW